MTEDSPDRHGIGGNAPPAPLTFAEIIAFLADSESALTDRRDELLMAASEFLAKHPTINDAVVAGAAADTLAMMRRAMRLVEERRKTAKEPFLKGGQAVDVFFNGLKDDLQRAGLRLAQPAKLYADRIEATNRAAAEAKAAQLAEDARAAAEAAEAAARAARPSADSLYTSAIKQAELAESAERHAAAKPAAHSRVIGEYGSTSALKEWFDVEVVNIEALSRDHMMADLPLLRRLVAGGARSIAGCRIFRVRSLQSRG